MSHALEIAPSPEVRRTRGTAYPVIERCLEEQAGRSTQNWLTRAFGFSPLRRSARPWYDRARRELEVTSLLAELGAEWTVLNVAPDGADAKDVDQIVVGPAGIFSVSIRNFVGKKVFASGSLLTVNGFKTNDMRDAWTAAKQTSELLYSTTGNEVVVTPLIVAVGVYTVRGGAKPPVVKVLPASMLAPSLAQAPVLLSEQAVAHFSAIIEQQLGLSGVEPQAEQTQRHAVRFDRLQQAVEAAAYRRRRLALAAGATLALGGPVATFAVTTMVLATVS